MVQYSQTQYDASFGALADATRRGVLEQLGRADASITALAEKFHMTLTGMKKHVGVLERAGLVSTEKVGRVRTCTLGQRGLEEEAAWLESYRELWAARFDRLDVVVEGLKGSERNAENPPGGTEGRNAIDESAGETAEVRLEGPKGRNVIAKGEALEPESTTSFRALKGRNKKSAIASKDKTNGNN